MMFLTVRILWSKTDEMVEKNQVLYEWDPYNSVIVAEHNG